MDSLFTLANNFRSGKPQSIVAICSAHPLVLRAALRLGKKQQTPVLIEATCNQVNQEGGYTGLNPKQFVQRIRSLCEMEDFNCNALILGGDHLGPNPWQHLKAEEAMSRAEQMVSDYAAAGFNKFHLDASMRCADDPEFLEEGFIASRAARMALVIEKTCKSHKHAPPAYIIGTEVPPPGGATHTLDEVTPTAASDALATVQIHRELFTRMGLEDAFSRVIGLVVQPGVEFGDVNVVQYQREKAKKLAHVLHKEPQLIFEAHSTDYQTSQSLLNLVQDGFSILKVGPWLTFALREALYALDNLDLALTPGRPTDTLMDKMETLMLSNSAHWDGHYKGSDNERRLKRHFSYSDRIRYYWPEQEAEDAVAYLTSRLQNQDIPETLLSQYLPASWRCAMQGESNPENWIINMIEQVILQYPKPSNQ